MRVAVRHTDKKHPNHGWFAYEQGRILGFTNPLDGDSFTPEQVADALLKRAQEQYPEAEGYEHRIETLHVGTKPDDNGNPVGEWHPVGKSKLPRVGQPVNFAEHELATKQGQAEGVKAE